jgi:hypothetical protein
MLTIIIELHTPKIKYQEVADKFGEGVTSIAIRDQWLKMVRDAKGELKPEGKRAKRESDEEDSGKTGRKTKRVKKELDIS